MGIKQHAGQTTIKLLVIRYIIRFCISIIIWIGIVVAGDVICINSGFILTGNYVESHMDEYRKAILDKDEIQDERISESMLPSNCSYAVYDHMGQYLYGNMKLSQMNHDQLFEKMIDQDELMNTMQHYTKITGTNHIYILQYNFSNKFKNPVLNRIIPSVEIAQIILLICGFIIILIIIASCLGRNLMTKMQYLNQTILSIQNQNLEFETKSSGIMEIDRIQESLNHMVYALKDSLNKQWNMEMERNDQISALAHDLKTPMTIVKGNVDLMQESELTIQQKEYMDYIAQGNDQMMQYLEQLLQITRMQTYHTKKEKIDTQEFLTKLVQVMTGFLSVKNFNLITQFHEYPDCLYIDMKLMTRALMNIVSNAAAYAPENTDIIFTCHTTCDQNQSNLELTIEDHGKGFSVEDKEKAVDIFYRGDQSRQSNGHYGIGLFVAKYAAQMHDGQILLENSEVTGGAKVIITLPVLEV